MAMTMYTVNSPEAVKLWSDKLSREALKKTWFRRFIGDGQDAILQRHTNFKKSAGDRLTVTLRMQLTADGVLGDNTLEGNEEALTTYTDNLFINQQRNAVRSAGRMSQQRVTFSIREEAMDGLSDWFANRYDTAMFNQLCGNTAINALAGDLPLLLGGSNAVIAPSAGRIYRPNGRATDEALTTGDEMTLQLIDYLVGKAKKATPVIRPVRWDGKDYYVLVLHTDQVTQLRTNTSTGQWLDIQKAAMTGGRIADNPIFTGALGEYNGVVLFDSTRITNGVNSTTGAPVTNARRAVFLGAQAGMIAFGGASSESSMDWNEELFDYGNQLGVSSGSIFGIKKSVYNSVDFGTIVLSTYTPDL